MNYYILTNTESVVKSSQATERTPRPLLGRALAWKAASSLLEVVLELQWILPVLALLSQHLALKSEQCRGLSLLYCQTEHSLGHLLIVQ